MTLLPSFNGNKTERTTKIWTSPDSRLTDVKRIRKANTQIFSYSMDVGGVPNNE